MKNVEFAAKDRPDITIETDDIAKIFAEVSSSWPTYFQSTTMSLERMPWGALEFTVRDKADVCVIFGSGELAFVPRKRIALLALNA